MPKSIKKARCDTYTSITNHCNIVVIIFFDNMTNSILESPFTWNRGKNNIHAFQSDPHIFLHYFNTSLRSSTSIIDSCGIVE